MVVGCDAASRLAIPWLQSTRPRAALIVRSVSSWPFA